MRAHLACCSPALLLLALSVARPAAADVPPPGYEAPRWWVAQGPPAQVGEARPATPTDDPNLAPEGSAPAGGGTAPGDPNLAPRLETAKPGKDVVYLVGLNTRFIFVPSGFLDAFTDDSVGLYSAKIGVEFIRRLEILDIVAWLNFGFYSPPDGTWLGNGKPVNLDTDYLQFKNFNLLDLGVSFVGHHWFTDWVSLIYGGGVGLAIPFGGIYRIDAQDCQGGDPATCIPAGADRARWASDKAYRDKYLADSRCPDDKECGPGRQYKEEGVWPVFPVLHLLLGVNFKVHEHVQVRVDGGFHNAFYFGVGGDYVF